MSSILHRKMPSPNGKNCTTITSLSTIKKGLEVPPEARAVVEVLIDGKVVEAELPQKLPCGGTPRFTFRWREPSEV